MKAFSRAAGLSIVAGSLALAHGAFAQQTLKVGAINPFSGPTAQYGAEVTRGFEMAADKLNASGGLLGRKIEIVHGDASNAQQGIQAVEQLMNKEKVDLFAGPTPARSPTPPVTRRCASTRSTSRPSRWPKN